MCKNLMVAGISPEKTENLHKFLAMMADRMSSGDRDGVGYAALTEHGLYGERWFNPKEAWRWRTKWNADKDKDFKKEGFFQGVKNAENKYNYFIENDKVVGAPPLAVIQHARMATVGERAIVNVHPFVWKGTALVHNGGIGNHTDKHLCKKYSTCDSEVILHSYLKHGVTNDPSAISKVAQDLRGGYACGALSRTKDGTPILDIFRNGAILWVMCVKELGDALVFATVNEMVMSVCRELNWKIGSMKRFNDDTFLRMDARTGAFLAGQKFQSGGWAGTNNRQQQQPSGSGKKNNDTDNKGQTNDADNDGEFCGAGVDSVSPTVLGPVPNPDNDESESASDAQTVIELTRAGEVSKGAQKKIREFPERSLTNPSSERESTFQRMEIPRIPPKTMELNRIKALEIVKKVEAQALEGPKEQVEKPGLDNPRNIDRILH
jgi:hypothetical protein